MLAFIFHTSKPRSYIAPFEAILSAIAKAHSLPYSSEFIETSTPYQYAFILKPPNAKASTSTSISANPNSTLDSSPKATDPTSATPLPKDFAQRVLDFSNALSLALPLSMYVVFERVEPEYVSRSSLRFYRSVRKCAKPLPMVSDVLELMQSFEQQDPRFKALCKQFFSSITTPNAKTKPRSTPSPNPTPSPTPDSRAKPIAPSALYACLDALSSELLTRPIVLDTARGCYELGTKPLESSALMFWEIGALQSFMRIDSTQLSCLASVEKPSMKLCPKDIFAKELLLQGVEIECLLAFDPMLMLLGSLARAKGVEYVFIRKSRATAKLAYTSPYRVPKLVRVVCGRDGILLHDHRTKEDLFSIIARHYPRQASQERAPKRQSEQNAHLMLVCYLSFAHPSALWIYDGASYKEALSVRFTSDDAQLLATLASEYKGADRLLANYQAHFGAHFSGVERTSTLESSAQSSPESSLESHLDSSYSKNLIDIFAPIARILQFCPANASDEYAKQSVLDCAKLCLRDKGPRIDYKLKKSAQGRLELDFPRILRSCMSFALAGVEREMIAFGVVDSLAEFVGGFVRDMAQNYAIKQAFICGDMCAHKIFFDKILLYLPRDIALILPQDGYLDTI